MPFNQIQRLFSIVMMPKTLHHSRIEAELDDTTRKPTGSYKNRPQHTHTLGKFTPRPHANYARTNRPTQTPAHTPVHTLEPVLAVAAQRIYFIKSESYESPPQPRDDVIRIIIKWTYIVAYTQTLPQTPTTQPHIAPSI